MGARPISIVRSENDSISGAYYDDVERLKKLKWDNIYHINVKQPRNPKFHNKFMALLNGTVQNLPEGFCINLKNGNRVFIENLDALLTQLKILTGHVDFKFSVTGEQFIEPKSISFAAMDEEKFSEFYDLAIDKILQFFLIGSSEKEVQRMVLQYMR